MIGPVPEAEDIGQETFLRFYKSLHRFRGDSSAGTYLTRIAINLTLNEIRRKKHRNETPFNEDFNSMEDVSENSSGESRRESRKLLTQGLQQLEPKFRSVVVLRLLDGYSTEETAQILKIPLGTVLSRLSRGQEKLREILAPLVGDQYEN